MSFSTYKCYKCGELILDTEPVMMSNKEFRLQPKINGFYHKRCLPENIENLEEIGENRLPDKKFIPQWYCENCKQEFGFVGSYYDLEDGKHCPNNGCNALLIPIE